MTAFAHKLLLPIILAAVVAVAGCAPGDIAFEGKVFDALGVNSSTSRDEVKVETRAPLVMPPATGALPKPGSEVNPADQGLAGIRDPETTRDLDKKRLAKAQKEYCDKHYDVQREAIGGADPDDVKGPLGPCRKSLLDNVSIEGLGL